MTAGGPRRRRTAGPRSDGPTRARGRSRAAPQKRTGGVSGEERLQKLLAAAGLGSRRACEDLIRTGQVTINGRVALLGDKADPARDSIKVAGKRVRPQRPHRYLLLNKPRGFVTTVSDPEGRPTVLDLVPERLRRGLRPVGRLDFDTEGLLLLTDDGVLGQRVSHPRFGCKKTYEVKVRGFPEPEQLDRLRRGITIDGRRTAPSEIHPRPGGRRRRPDRSVATADRKRGATRGGGRRPSAAEARSEGPQRLRRTRAAEAGGRPLAGDRRRGDGDAATNSWWVVRLAEGRSRQIREMFQRIGHPVQKLRRVAIGTVRDPGLPVGALRELSEQEVVSLREPSR